jgi:hypothetical protein
MMRVKTTVIWVAFAGAFLLLPVSETRAQTAPAGIKVAQALPPAAAAEVSAQSRHRRPLRRVPIYPRYQPEPDGVYPRYYPGPNAVRDCTATYVQEYRPSGTVIVPRMSCFWRPG